ncbi:MAG TPA: histidinol-phosphate transaminase [Gemmatimonadales bacterium]|nr:histidinol-phosphate transaminase [Gemmatimonadales bacterium]
MSSRQPPHSTSPSPTSTSSPGPGGRLPDAADGLALIKPLVRSQPGYSLAAAEARHKLNQNESPLDFPPELKQEVLDRALVLPWQRYPAFTPRDLQESIAARYGWVPDGVIVGNGSNELIQATLGVSLGGDDVVVAPSPTFSLYRLITGVLGGRYVPVPLSESFHFDVPRLIETARREQARVIVLNSPNNPTGSALPSGAVEQLLDETNALILCDEAYQDFGGPSSLQELSRSSRVVVLRTFSKAFGLAGLRFGFALAHPAVAEEIAKGKLPYNVNLITLAAAKVALRHAAALAARVEELIDVRERFLADLRRLPGLVVYPTAANFVLVRCVALPASDVFQRLHQQHGILVRDVSGAPGLAECLRISIGTAEDMAAVIRALDEILSGRHKSRGV